MEAGSLKSSYHEGHAVSEISREDPFFVSSSLWGLPAILSVPGFADRSLQSLFIWPSPLCLCPNFLLLIRTPVVFRARPNPAWPHLYLLSSVKILSPNKVTHTGSVWTSIWGEHYSTQYTMFLPVPSPHCSEPPWTTAHLDFPSYFSGPGVPLSPTKFLVNVLSGCHKLTTFNPWV